VTPITKAQMETEDVNHSANRGAEKERCIYPNLKLRVYTTGMRQNRLAKLVGIDEAYLSRIINGVRVPGKQMRLQIARSWVAMQNGCSNRPESRFQRTRHWRTQLRSAKKEVPKGVPLHLCFGFSAINVSLFESP